MMQYNNGTTHPGSCHRLKMLEQSVVQPRRGIKKRGFCPYLLFMVASWFVATFRKQQTPSSLRGPSPTIATGLIKARDLCDSINSSQAYERFSIANNINPLVSES